MPGVEELQQKVHKLALESMGNEDILLGVPFSADELSAAVSKLKCGKAAGPDGLMDKHWNHLWWQKCWSSLSYEA